MKDAQMEQSYSIRSFTLRARSFAFRQPNWVRSLKRSVFGVSSEENPCTGQR
jgi:hypothetical protein